MIIFLFVIIKLKIIGLKMKNVINEIDDYSYSKDAIHLDLFPIATNLSWNGLSQKNKKNNKTIIKKNKDKFK